MPLERTERGTGVDWGLAETGARRLELFLSAKHSVPDLPESDRRASIAHMTPCRHGDLLDVRVQLDRHFRYHLEERAAGIDPVLLVAFPDVGSVTPAVQLQCFAQIMREQHRAVHALISV